MVLETLTEALLRRFPKSGRQDVTKFARSIIRRNDIAQSLDAAWRRNVPPKKDLDNLTRARNHVERARKLINGLGLYGWAALRDQIERSSQDCGPLDLERRLSEISEALEGAAEEINTDAGPFLDFIGEGEFPSPGRPSPQAPLSVVRTCATIYEELTGDKATRRTDWDSGESYGPFFDMVAEIFEILGIEASVERAVRQGLAPMD